MFKTGEIYMKNYYFNFGLTYLTPLDFHDPKRISPLLGRYNTYFSRTWFIGFRMIMVITRH